MTVAISISNLVKTFGATRALDHLDLTVETGEVHGFLGPNGAGKSTAIRVLLGLLRHDSGDVTLLGGDPWRDAVPLHRRLAYVPGDVKLWPNLSGGEVIDLFGALRGGLNPEKRSDLIERFKLDPTKKCGTYSKGNLQKVAIIAAFASDVELYLLDEPTAGLDPLMASIFRECVTEVKRAGATVLLSSHILADVEMLADRISIIRDGKIVESGTLAELRHLTRTSVSVETSQKLTGLADLPGVHVVSANSVQAHFQVDTEHLDRVLQHLTQFGVRSLESHPPTLEELFMRHYGLEGATVERDEVAGGTR